MDGFTARPEKIISNIAYASLMAGAPASFVLLVIGIFFERNHYSLYEWTKNSVEALCFGPFVLFITGILILYPILFILRYVGLGGPFFVYAISAVSSIGVLSSSFRLGIVAFLLSIPASYVFCKQSYSN